MSFLGKQEKSVLIFLVVGVAIGFAHSYYKKYHPPIDIRFKEPLPEDSEEIRPIEDILKEEKSVNINTAGIKDLIKLKGIGPALAGRILEYRRLRGEFTKAEEIKEVRGIGPKKFRAIKDFIKLE